jgi:hypothetical protein
MLAVRHSPSLATLIPVSSISRCIGVFGDTEGNVHHKSLLAMRQRCVFGRRPVHDDQVQQAFVKSGRLAQRHTEEHFLRQAWPESCTFSGLLSVAPAGRRSLPDHSGSNLPYGQRSAIVCRPAERRPAPPLKRFILGGLVSGHTVRACRPAHVFQLSCWIHDMNRSPVLCFRAVPDTRYSRGVFDPKKLK